MAKNEHGIEIYNKEFDGFRQEVSQWNVRNSLYLRKLYNFKVF